MKVVILVSLGNQTARKNVKWNIWLFTDYKKTALLPLNIEYDLTPGDVLESRINKIL